MKPDKYIKNYINGQLVPPHSGEYLDNINPATGAVYAQIPDSGEKDLQDAVNAATKAYKTWSVSGMRKRFRILMRIADILEQNAEALAIAESVDTGKAITRSRTMDIPRSHSNMRFFATAVTQFSSESHAMEREAINFTLRQPIGLVGIITPWNSPLHFFTWKIAPALAVGNCVIAKPSELAPMSVYMLSKACMEAGLPPGVLNIIHGHGNTIGQQIVEHPEIKAISFTGSSQTGKQIALAAAPHFKKLSLDLSGKNPNIIFKDCDLERALATTLSSTFSNQGQLSVSTSRILVERPLYEDFKNEIVKRTQYLKVGDPLSPITNIGAIISSLHQEKIMSYIALAKLEGGQVLCGGELLTVSGKHEKGFFVKPTLIEGLPMNSRTNQEEIFGPVATIAPFDTEEEAITYANQSNYGLSATVWTENIGQANRVAEQLQVGSVWVNCWLLRDLRTPYGGLKHSGVGRDGGIEALRFFTEAKNVCLKF